MAFGLAEFRKSVGGRECGYGRGIRHEKASKAVSEQILIAALGSEAGDVTLALDLFRANWMEARGREMKVAKHRGGV